MNLINKGTHWVVAFVQKKELIQKPFTTVDSACDYLVDSLGIKDEEVDTAVINLHVLDHRVAVFDQGQFSHTETH